MGSKHDRKESEDQFQQGMPPVPVGIQRLLRLASEDSRFRSLLVRQRSEVARAAGIELTRSEEAILAAVSARQLDAMIDKVPAPAPDRRDFFRQSAASAVVLLGGATLGLSASGCEERPMLVTGVRPDLPPERVDAGGAEEKAPEERPTPPASSDTPPERVEDPEHPKAIGGVLADEPPPRPERSDTIRLGGVSPR
jgi:hypothetical protein